MYALEKGVANLLRHAFQLNPIIRAKILQYKTYTSRCIRSSSDEHLCKYQSIWSYHL